MRTAQRTEFAFRDSDFQTVVRLVREQTGIVLGDHKRDLVYGRLSKRLRAMGMEDFAGYCELVESEEGVAERRQMVNAITTNLTGFFREPHHFEFLGSTVLAALKRDKQTTQRRLRLWSAGCSSGEEPYSIAMILRDSLAHEAAGWDARILATDIDTDVLARARSGLYDEERADAVPAGFRNRFLRKLPGGKVEMADPLKSLITFKPLNLFDPWPMKGPFDAIFCRNVVIYFSKEDQRTLFGRFADMLVPGGYMFIGHSETLFRVSDQFRLVGRTIYQKCA
jgi:chemotaxis protein methyltransferase CheR